MTNVSLLKIEIMKKSNLQHPIAEDVRLLGQEVEVFMRHSHLTTEWVRRESHFGTTDFTHFKKAS
jgi:hypothetical protein